MLFERNTGNKQCIDYDNDTGFFSLHESAYSKFPGTIYFIDVKTAKAAIVEIVKPFIESHPEFDLTKM